MYYPRDVMHERNQIYWVLSVFGRDRECMCYYGIRWSVRHMNNNIWDDCDYSQKNYIGRPVTEEGLWAAEKILGYKLPEAYKKLLLEHNGGILKASTITVDDNDYYAEGLYGVDPKVNNSLLSEKYGSKFWIEEWEYPSDVGIAFADTPSAGHDMFFLDYRECGPMGDPAVVLINQENDYKITKIANTFQEFLDKLHEETEE